MLQYTDINSFENHSFKNYGQIGKAAKFIKFFSLILVFGAFLLLSAAETARAAEFIVDRTDDANVSACTAAANDCTLRGAISAANVSASDDVINFDNAVFSTTQTITLNGTHLNIENNGRLMINGTGANLLTVSGNNQSAVFRIEGSATAIINKLRVTAGNSQFGGGISNFGALSFIDSILSNCQSNDGGGVYSGGALYILRSTITGNTVTGSGGGGGIRKEGGFLTLSSSTVSNNSASAGGGILNVAGTTNIEFSNINNNTSTDTGGGIRSDSGIVNINGSNILSNTAVSEGGGIRNNTILSISDSTIDGNSSGGGGGGIINVNLGLLDISFSTIKNNESEDAGGGLLQIGQANIQYSTINNNTADGGGGIFNRGSNSLILEQSTVFGNSAQEGGGIANVGTVELRNVTIASNQAVSGAGIINVSGTIDAINTLIADNLSQDVFGTINSLGYNLIENPRRAVITGDFTGVITGVDPMLDPSGLRDNGGKTRTVSLQPGSIAIDKGIQLFSVDQRLKPRPVDFPNIPNAAGGNGADIGAFERQFTEIVRRTLFDFDGDGKSDISVFRPSDGNWYIRQSSAGFKAVSWGLGTDTLVPGDYDGDGRTDYAVTRVTSASNTPSGDNLSWYILRSSDNTFQTVKFGIINSILFDIPVPADYDGDGKTDYAYFRLTDLTFEPGRFNILRSSDNTVSSIQFGAFGDKPIPADYDGDGKADVAVNRRGIWLILNSSNNQSRTVQFGTAQDKLVPADYDGDGKTDIAVYRESNGSWYYLQSGNGNNFVGVQFGASGDKPVPADYDGDGKTDIAVFRPSNGAWYRLNSSDNSFNGLLFGFGTDKPIPNAFVR